LLFGRILKALCATSIAASIVLGTVVAQADEAEVEHRLVWRWNRFNTLDYISTAALGLTFLAIELGTETPEEANWKGGILFDDAVRDAMVGDTRDTRDAHAIASDYLSLTNQVLLFFDSAAVPVFFDRWNFDVAWQLTMIDLQALALSGVLARAGHHFVGRERPDLEPCKEDNDYHGKCFGGTNASFPGGHLAASVTASTLNCVHHFKLGLYGNEVADGSACALGLTIAATVGAERLITDRHWASDQVAAIGLGLGAGLALPLVLHYKPASEPHAKQTVRWTIAPAPEGSLGASVYGWM
jgi:membrane-associated phospholipid phosphatase